MAQLSRNEKAIVVTALKHAAPYIRLYKRKVFVLFFQVFTSDHLMFALFTFLFTYYGVKNRFMLH